MTLVANLDAHIEQHYADAGESTREIQIFGRVWPMIGTLTTLQLNPLMQMQAAAQIAADPAKGSPKDRMMALAFLAGINDMFTDVIHESVREEFREIINAKGIPAPVVENVIEAIMTVYDAAPFHSEGQTATPAPTPGQPPVSTTTSGSSPESAGQTSTPNYTPTSPPTIPAPAPPVPAAPLPHPPASQQAPAHGNGYGMLQPMTPEQAGAPMAPYESQIPPSLAQG